GTALGAYSFTRYKSEPGDTPVAEVHLVPPDYGTEQEHQDSLTSATATAEAVVIARDLINTPPNDLFPASFAGQARELAESAGLEFEVLDEHELATGGFGGILGVGSGS